MDLKEIFKRTCLIRHFENQVAEAVEKGFINCPVYLSIGQETISAVVSTLTENFAIFSQHRGHSVYLAHGGNIERLIDELLSLQTGCCRGRGGSPCIQDLNIKMHGHHGLIGENIPLATGYALATKEKTVAYFGDAAAEEDYALTSMGFAATHKLPILFVCENNNLSILTPIKTRRSWNVSDVAKAMGLATSVVEDEPELIFESAEKLISNLPAYLEVKTNRHRWHTGIGIDEAPKYDRLEEMRDKIEDAPKIEEEIKIYLKNLWEKHLPKQ